MTENWRAVARPEQLAPSGDWWVWLMSGGRASGKTRAAAEWVHKRAMEQEIFIILVGSSMIDIRESMIEGMSGLLAVAPQDEKPEVDYNRRLVRWPNGSRASFFESTQDPDQFRGAQSHIVWGDNAEFYSLETLGMLLVDARLGENPQILLSGTPHNWSHVFKYVKKMARKEPRLYRVTNLSLEDNIENLSPEIVAKLRVRYLGTFAENSQIHGF